MIVFKTVLKVINRLKGMLILYTVILVAISLMNQFNSKGTVITTLWIYRDSRFI